MTLPADIVFDAHQDGMRCHVNTHKIDEELFITGPYAQTVAIPFKQLPLLIDWLKLAEHLVAQRRQGHRPVRLKE